METIIYKEDETIDARDLFPPLPLLSIKLTSSIQAM
jgi:hypothetical protein